MQWQTYYVMLNSPRIPRHVVTRSNSVSRPMIGGGIDRAAALTGKSKTDFVLEAARRAAKDASLDRTLFIATPDAFEALRARLDEHPSPNERLRRSMQIMPPWK